MSTKPPLTPYITETNGIIIKQPIMKLKLPILVAIVFLALSNPSSQAQSNESSGLLGDGFSLENALESFKTAQSIEAFEKALNAKSSHIHNLDLNEDNEVDYIVINDYSEGNIHTLVISALIGENDLQDIAVIEIEKSGENTAYLQIIGDEDLYGADKIIEPSEIETTSNGRGPSMDMTYARVQVNVWAWPSIQYVYSPRYRLYRSSWRWSLYPNLYRPWRPLAWVTWNPFRVRHQHRYSTANSRLTPLARRIYAPHRHQSATVVVKHRTSVTKARSYRNNSGNRVAVSKTTKSKVSVKNNKTSNTKIKSASTTKKVKASKKNGKKVKVKTKKTVKKKTQ